MAAVRRTLLASRGLSDITDEAIVDALLECEDPADLQARIRTLAAVTATRVAETGEEIGVLVVTGRAIAPQSFGRTALAHLLPPASGARGPGFEGSRGRRGLTPHPLNP